MVNARAKGHGGEREVVRWLNDIIQQLLMSNTWDAASTETILKCIQRNQNQSAIGGCDLSNVFGLAIEIKRVQVLAVEAWWKQCTAQAARNNEHPVLLYRQNNQPWRCVTLGHAPLPGGRMSSMRVQFEADAFSTWFYQWVYYKVAAGELPRV